MECETTVPSKQVPDIETAMMQEQEQSGSVHTGRSTTTKPEIVFEEMLNAIRDSPSDLATSANGEDGEDEHNDEEDTRYRKLSKDDEPGWVIGRVSNTVQHGMESFRPKLMRLDELTQLESGDVA